jgi:hypothetical protein
MNYTLEVIHLPPSGVPMLEVRWPVMFGKKTLMPISLDAIMRRIAEIDHKFEQTDCWLHSC